VLGCCCLKLGGALLITGLQVNLVPLNSFSQLLLGRSDLLFISDLDISQLLTLLGLKFSNFSNVLSISVLEVLIELIECVRILGLCIFEKRNIFSLQGD
jgi:hypothetical protein